MEKSIAILCNALTRFTKSQTIPRGDISSKQRHRSRSRQRDHYFFYRRFRSRSPQRFNNSSWHYMVIGMAVDHPPQISHLMPHNRILMANTRNASNIVMIIRSMSSRVAVTMRMWGTCLLRTTKQLQKFHLQRVKTLRIYISLRWQNRAAWRNRLKLQ